MIPEDTMINVANHIRHYFAGDMLGSEDLEFEIEVITEILEELQDEGYILIPSNGEV